MAGENQIEAVRSGLNSVIVTAPEGSSWKDPDNCSGNNSGVYHSVAVSETTDSYKEIFSIILAARVSGQK